MYRQASKPRPSKHTPQGLHSILTISMQVSCRRTNLLANKIHFVHPVGVEELTVKKLYAFSEQASCIAEIAADLAG
jgi:hypothetical protein